MIKKLIPKGALNFYHKILALTAALLYGYPSEKMTVIGVTGTNGKTTTVYLIAKALEAGGLPAQAGAKVGATSTAIFKVGEREWLNAKKMTMLGRFQLQKLLKQMVQAGCKYAVVEVSSEGIKQYRHVGINFDYAVFTNLTPEHIESHGSFENYKKAKGELFKRLTSATSGTSKTSATSKTKKISVINIDDDQADYFLSFPADKKITFGVGNSDADFSAKNIVVSLAGISFEINQQKINLKLIGAFNVYNALPALAISLNEGLEFPKIKQALEAVTMMPGRMEFINEGQSFKVLVDYAPEPASMEKMYETVRQLREQESKTGTALEGDHFCGTNQGNNETTKQPAFVTSFAKATEVRKTTSGKPNNKTTKKKESETTERSNLGDYNLQPTTYNLKNKIIHVLGSCGGGRDKARRPILGRLAGANADIVIVTNEDPYDDNPQEVIDQVAAGALEKNKVLDKTLFKILDRKEAIRFALSLARPEDWVIVTGKGAEQAMALARGKYIFWDDRQIIRENLAALGVDQRIS